MTVKAFLQGLGLHNMWRDIKGNRRLQWGLAIVLAILAVEGVLRWTDALTEQEKELRELRDQKRHLQGQIQDKTLLQEILQKVEGAQTAAKARVWVVSSEAVGQARQKDWVQTLFREKNIPLQSLVLATPRGREKPVTESGITADKVADIREFRATVSFPFSPENLERIVAALEGGELFTRIESLSASRRQRRVELEFAMLMEIDPRAAARAESSPVQDTADPKAVEIEAAVKTVMEQEARGAAP